jgi:hypothetical protein
LRLLSIPCALILVARSIGKVTAAFGAFLGGPGATDPGRAEPSLQDTLARSGALWALALVAGVSLLTAVAAIARRCFTDPSGAISLQASDDAVLIVRRARAAAVSARDALARVRSSDIRLRLAPSVDALDGTTCTMATVMAAGVEEELAQRCAWVTNTAADLEPSWGPRKRCRRWCR